MQFEAAVEQWRPLVALYFPPNLVDKALWVIKYESGGNPGAVGDNGVARGLFQIQDERAISGRPNAAFLDNPDNNIRYAAEQLGGANGSFGAWGEGTTYQGKPFGALGNHPYPGDDGKVEESPVMAAFRRWKNYTARWQTWSDKGGAEAGIPYPFTDAENEQFQTDQIVVDQYLKDITKGDVSADDIISKYKFWNETDPALIDAENTANQYAREIDVRKQAADLASTLLVQANDMQQKAVADRQGYMTVDRGGALMRRPGGGLIPSARVPTIDELFDKSLTKLKEGLPEVKPIPYPERPAGLLTGTGAGTPPLSAQMASAFNPTPFPPSPPGTPTGARSMRGGPTDESGMVDPSYVPGSSFNSSRPSRTTATLLNNKVPNQLAQPITFQSLGIKTGGMSGPTMGAQTGDEQPVPFWQRGRKNTGNFFQRLTGSLFGGF